MPLKFNFYNSVLYSKKPNIKNLNIKDLGWIAPNGEIHFQNHDAALKYAKNRCVSALKGKNPIEIGVALKDSIILGECNGTRENAHIEQLKFIIDRKNQDVNADIVLVHGHPDRYGKGKTTPLSAPSDVCGGDISLLELFKLKSIIAYNSNGEYSCASRGKTFKENSLSFLSTLFDKIHDQLLDSNKLVDRYKELSKLKLQYQKNGKPIPSIIKQEMNEILTKLSEVDKRVKFDENYPKILHECYKECLPRVGIEYKTNFSNLKP